MLICLVFVVQTWKCYHCSLGFEENANDFHYVTVKIDLWRTALTLFVCGLFYTSILKSIYWLRCGKVSFCISFRFYLVYVVNSVATDCLLAANTPKTVMLVQQTYEPKYVHKPLNHKIHTRNVISSVAKKHVNTVLKTLKYTSSNLFF